MKLENLSKNKKLVLGIVLDVVGMITVIDIIWAPVSSLIMSQMYAGRKGKVAAVFSFIEEILPGFDIIPSFTIMWFYTYVFSKKTNLIEIKVK